MAAFLTFFLLSSYFLLTFFLLSSCFLLTFFLLSSSTLADPYMGIRLCNKLQTKIFYAMSGGDAIETRSSSGWFSLQPGECTEGTILTDGHKALYSSYGNHEENTKDWSITRYDCLRDNDIFKIENNQYSYYRDRKNDRGLYSSCYSLGDNYRLAKFIELPLTHDKGYKRYCILSFVEYAPIWDCGEWYK